MAQQTLSFSRVDSAKFFRTLNKRVNNYFKENIWNIDDVVRINIEKVVENMIFVKGT